MSSKKDCFANIIESIVQNTPIALKTKKNKHSPFVSYYCKTEDNRKIKTIKISRTKGICSEIDSNMEYSVSLDFNHTYD